MTARTAYVLFGVVSTISSVLVGLAFKQASETQEMVDAAWLNNTIFNDYRDNLLSQPIE